MKDPTESRIGGFGKSFSPIGAHHEDHILIGPATGDPRMKPASEPPPRRENRMVCMHRGPLLIGPAIQALYDNKIDFSIRGRHELGFEWEIRTPSREERFEFGSSASLAEAVLDLVQAAVRLYPDSELAKEYKSKLM